MTTNWEKSYLNNLNCENIVSRDADGEFVVRGYEKNIDSKSTIIYWAANPPTYNGSYAGSALPFPNAEIAYQNTINKGTVKTIGGHYEFKIRFPNAYYVNMGTDYIEPCVHIKICQTHGENKIKTIKLGNSIPFRLISYPNGEKGTIARNSNAFYDGRDNLPIRTQEQILRDSGFPEDNKVSKNFWGLVPPHS